MNNNLERKIDELHDNIENKVDKLLKSNNQQKKKDSDKSFLEILWSIEPPERRPLCVKEHLEFAEVYYWPMFKMAVNRFLIKILSI